MKSKQLGNEHVLVFAAGEKVLVTLNTYLTQHNITGAKFVAIGGFSQVQLEYFNVQTKQYEHRDVNEQVEVISLIGNVALADGKPFAPAAGWSAPWASTDVQASLGQCVLPDHPLGPCSLSVNNIA